jgi:hypothetical protein
MTWLVRLARVGAAALMILFRGTGEAAAQRTLERSGFFIGLGLGYGSLDLTCDGCDFDRQSGLSGYLRLGGAVSDRVLLGVESNGWYKSEDGVGVTAGTLTGSVYVYPSSEADLFVRGGVGIASLDSEDINADTGFGWSVGLGYDIPIGRKTALTPYANWFVGHFDGGGTNTLQVGLGVNWY